MPPVVKTENKYGLDWVLLNNRWYSVQNYSPTKLADGADIPIVTDGTTWAGLTTPARCVYNNSTDAEFIAKYGYLYNWYGVDEGLEMPCDGCVVPSEAEWTELQTWMIANGFNWDGTTTGNDIGKAMASSGGEWDASATEGHVGNDQDSNNSSGFTMFPTGFRYSLTGAFVLSGERGRCWANEPIGSIVAVKHDSERMNIYNAGFDSVNGRAHGLALRISRPYVKKQFLVKSNFTSAFAKSTSQVFNSRGFNR